MKDALGSVSPKTHISERVIALPSATSYTLPPSLSLPLSLSIFFFGRVYFSPADALYLNHCLSLRPSSPLHLSFLLSLPYFVSFSIWSFEEQNLGSWLGRSCRGFKGDGEGSHEEVLKGMVKGLIKGDGEGIEYAYYYLMS